MEKPTQGFARRRTTHEPPAIPVEAIDPGEFIQPRLYATDPSMASLAQPIRIRPRGMMLIRDELSGLFANMARDGNARAFWLEAWNGGRYLVERVSKSIVIEHLLVGVIGGLQPDKIARAFRGDEDGMSGRFLFAWPSTPDYRPLSNDIREVEPDFYNALKVLLELPAEDAKGKFTHRDVWLSDAAIATFEEFRKFIDLAKRDLDGRERQWVAKAEIAVLAARRHARFYALGDGAAASCRRKAWRASSALSSPTRSMSNS